MYDLIDKVHRFNVDLRNLVVLTFPRNQKVYRTYLELCKRGILSPKLKTHPVYSEKIIEHLDVPTSVYWHDEKETILWCKRWTKNGLLHREGDLPACVWWYENGKLARKVWLKEGKMHRDCNLPSSVWFHENGKLYRQEWWKEDKGTEIVIYPHSSLGMTMEH